MIFRVKDSINLNCPRGLQLFVKVMRHRYIVLLSALVAALAFAALSIAATPGIGQITVAAAGDMPGNTTSINVSHQEMSPAVAPAGLIPDFGPPSLVPDDVMGRAAPAAMGPTVTIPPPGSGIGKG